jgi:hypothetical protein
VFIGSTGDELCQAHTVRLYDTVRGETLNSAEKLPLSKSRFVELVGSALARARVSVTGYSGHSFRIGAATAAPQAGIPHSVIQALGH